MPSVDVFIEDLLLDLENPRFDGLENQKDALEKIVVSQGRKLVNLADDIVLHGLSPLHRVLALKSKEIRSKYVVLDGNRRLSALKVLSNPACLDPMKDVGDVTKKRLRALAQQFDRSEIEPLEVFLPKDREEARHWIEAVHTGENEGRGVVSWDGVATARFRGKSASIKILEFLKSHGKLSVEELASLERFPITNLDRLIKTPEVRDRLGVDLEEGDVGSDLPVSELVKGLKRVVTDLASGGVTVSKIKSKADRISYIEKLGAALPDLSKRTGKFETLESLAATTSASSTATKATARKGVLAERKTLIPRQCKLHIDDEKMQDIVRELRKLSLENYPIAIGTLFRVFLELSLDHFGGNKMSGWRDDVPLKKKIDSVADFLLIHGTAKRDLEPFRRLAHYQAGALSVDRLHGIIHNKYALPTPNELRKGWSEVQHVFEIIWAP